MNAIYTQQSVRKNVATNLASLNIAHSLLAILFVGLVLTVSGIMIECNYQANLLNQGGNALETYQAMMHTNAIDSVFQYMVTGIQFQLPSAAGNLQAIGLTICCIIAPTIVSAQFALRIFGFNSQLTDWKASLA